MKESNREKQEDYISYRLWLKKAEKVRTVIGWMGDGRVEG